ncbi:MAG: conjugal transfer protein TrbC [Sphingobium sp.]|nr:conjugal transfer protein TrbC [Sphingobium sp.]
MDRLRKAMAKRKGTAITGPSMLPALPQDLRRRAFEGLKERLPSREMDQRARAARDAAAHRLDVEQAAMNAKIYKALGLAPPGTDPEQNVAAATGSSATASWVPVLFVSSSMPVETLRTYAGQLERARGILAFRGVPGGLGRIGPMAELSARILRRDPGCEGPACAMRDVQLIVDPILFRQHGVARVPALAMVPGDPTQPYCEREDQASPPGAHLVFGDAALSGLLEEYGRIGGDKEVKDAQARLRHR